MEQPRPDGVRRPPGAMTRRQMLISGLTLAGLLGVGAGFYAVLRNTDAGAPRSGVPRRPTATSTGTAAPPTAAPTRGPVLVTTTPDDIPTATATPTASATPEPTAAPPPTPTALRGPRAPLTGRPIAAEIVGRRPLAVKVANNPGARPQWGLQAADIVYEHLTEGYITRHTAIFQSNLPNRIGPTRSARLIDIDIALEYQALLAHVGGSPGVLEQLKAIGTLDVEGLYYPLGRVFFRTTDAVPPDNTYVDGPNLALEARARGLPDEVRQETWQFLPPETELSSALQTVEFPSEPSFPDGFRSFYSYDPSRGSYLRFLAAAPHIDAANSAQIVVDNVIVQWTDISLSNIVEDFLGSRSRIIPLTGDGRAMVFSGGRAIEGFWRRQGRQDRTRFQSADGQEIAFKPGNTWIHVLGAQSTIAINYP